MSDYGVFEASSTDGYEEDQRQRQATRDLGRAIQAAREGFGDFLGAATDKQDYKDRLALVMNDLMQKVADSGVMPVPGVMRKVKAALRPEFRTAAGLDEFENMLRANWGASFNEFLNEFDEESQRDAREEFKNTFGVTDAELNGFLPSIGASRKQARTEDEIRKARDDLDKKLTDALDEGGRGDEVKELRQKLRDIDDELSDSMRESSRKQASVEDLRSYVESKGVTTSDKDNGFTFPTADGAKGHIYENRAGDIVVQTLIGGSGGGVQSNYSQDETELVKEWIDRTASRKQAAKCPKCDGMGRETYEKENGSLSTQTCTECGGTGKVASRKQAGLSVGDEVYWYGGGDDVDTSASGVIVELPAVDPDGRVHSDMAAVEWSDEGYEIVEINNLLNAEYYNIGQGYSKALGSRKQADVNWYDQNGRQEAHFAGGEHITVFPDGKWEVSTGAFLDSGQAPSVEQAKAESLEALSLLAFGSRKQADDYVRGDALNFINHLQNGGYRMPKDAGYPGEGGQMDDEIYDYTNGDQTRMAELIRFLQENWDYYAYGASRKQASDVNTEDRDVLQFFYQFENEGLDVSASGDEQWEWLKSNIDYDTLQDAIDQAHEYGEMSASQANSMAYDLQQNFFGSRKQAYDASSIPAKHSVWIDEFQGEPGYELTAEGIWEDFKGWAQSRGESPGWDNFDDFLDQYPEADFIDEKIDSELTRKLDGNEGSGAPWRGLGARKHAESYQLGGGWSAKVVYDNDDEGEYAEAILTGPGGVEETIYPGDGRRFEPNEVKEEAQQIIDEYGDSAYQDTYQYNSRRKRAGGGRSSRKTASNEALLLDSISELMLKGNLSAEDQDAIERAYGQGEQGKWEAAYNSVTFVADGPDLGSWEDGLVEAILDGIEDLVGDPSRKARRKQALELGEWEEDLPGLGYAKATKTPGGGWEVYIWDEAGQNETLTPVNSPEEARRLFQDTIKSYPGSGFDHIDF